MAPRDSAEQPQQEHPSRLEKERSYLYSEIVLGHPFSGVDRDQIVAAYIAKKFGIVSESAPIKTTSHIDEDIITNNTSLVIEGFSSKKRSDFNKKTSGKFINNPVDDLPAASCFFNALREDIPNQTPEEKNTKAAIGEIVQWLNAVDRRKDFKPPLTFLSKDNLDEVTDLFNSLRYKQLSSSVPDQNAFFEDCFKVLDQVLDAGQTGKKVASVYQSELKNYREYKQAKISEMQQVARHSENFHYSVSKTGIKLAVFSITGIEDPVDFGANGVVSGRVKELTKTRDNPEGDEPDVTILFNSETDEHGKKVGTKVYIQLPEDVGGDGIKIRDLLVKRLDWLESQFGRGFVFTADTGYGGHPGVVASAPFTGSSLEENAIQFALESFFDHERFTDDQFIKKAGELASLIGVEKYYPSVWVSPDNQWKLPEPAIEFTVPDKEAGDFKVQISESDLQIYSQVLKDIPPDKRQEWLLGKTAFVEPREIIELREQRAIESLQSHLENKNIFQILADLNEINTVSVRNLPKSLKFQILSLFADNQGAISKVYDIKDRQYRISVKYLPDFLLDPKNITEYQGARYTYDSLPKKFDSALIGSLVESAATSGDREEQLASFENISKIIFSAAYKDSHKEYQFDNLLVSALRFGTDAKVPADLSSHFFSQVSSQYGPEMSDHWRNLVKTHPGLLVRSAGHSAEFSRLLNKIDIDITKIKATDYIEGVPHSQVVNLDTEALKDRFTETKKETPAANIIVEIGRDSLDAILNQGFSSWEDGSITALESVDGRVATGPISMERPRESDDQSQKIAEKVTQMLVTALQSTSEFPDSKVRIVLASGPIQTPLDLSSKLSLKVIGKQVSLKDLLRIYTIRFNMTSNEYEELPLYRGTDRETLLELISE